MTAVKHGSAKGSIIGKFHQELTCQCFNRGLGSLT